MGLFSFFKKKAFFTADENQRVVEAIRNCEKRTSGEIRVFIESRNLMVDPLERAAQIFFQLKMEQTQHHNAVLLYIALKDKELALFGDSGIHEHVGTTYWSKEVENMLVKFRENNLVDGIVECVLHVGETLCQKFPYHATDDKNELPDEIVFGK